MGHGSLHLALHLLVPLLVAWVFFRKLWIRAFVLMLLGMIIDLDHLLADPIFDPGRCSIGFHPLHTAVPVVLYGLALLHRRTRLVGIGLLIHIGLDLLDCRFVIGRWFGG